jgi:hypothetical protein
MESMETTEQQLAPAEESSEDTKKRKLDVVEKRRYYCTFPGCNRDYSRAEHLYRHQLNRQC